MSRIEEALAKLQARQSAQAGAAPRGQLGAQVPKVGNSSTASPPTYGGLPITVDTARLLEQQFIAPNAKEQALADEYRALKRPLLKTIRDAAVARSNLWMVTSAVAGEGKTFTSINLAMSIAREQDWTIVLVDGDCSKAHLTRLFGVTEQRGLMDLLRDPKLDFDSLVMPTNIPRLSLLPAGSREERAAEFLSSARMANVCEALASGDPHRIVLFDSPPLLQAAEAPALAAQLGQILLVVRANHTARQAVLAAIHHLDPSKAINLLLNQAEGRERPARYGHEYGDYGQPQAELAQAEQP
jgi:protein-tyrosine kinase